MSEKIINFAAWKVESIFVEFFAYSITKNGYQKLLLNTQNNVDAVHQRTLSFDAGGQVGLPAVEHAGYECSAEVL